MALLPISKPFAGTGQWVEFDIGETVQLSGFLTRGVGVAWTSIFKMGHGLSPEEVEFIQEDGEDKLFFVQGNGLKGARFDFSSPVRTRVMRFIPMSWYFVLAIRVEFMGCRITGQTHRHIPDDVICGEGWGLYKGGCYKRILAPLPWDRAETYCQALKGSLVSVHTQEEHDFLYARARTGWLGLRLPDHVRPTEFRKEQRPEVLATMRWRDGMPVQPFFPWHPNDTVHDHARCVEMTPPGYWILRDCNSPKKPFICKRDINPWIKEVYQLVNETSEHVKDPNQPIYPHAYNYDHERFWGMQLVDMDACRSCGHDADTCDHVIQCGTEDSEICGVIRSPGYPLSFPVDSICTVQINGPRKSYIVLQVLDIDIPVEADGSCSDRAVFLLDQKYPGGPWIEGARLCSPRDIREPFNSKFNSMQVKALSNDTKYQYRGYLAVYNITYYKNQHLPPVYKPNEVYQCPCDYNLYEDRCYGIFTHHTHLSWTRARLECHAKNGTLASMSDGLETEFLHTALILIVQSRQLGGEKMYIGLQDRNEFEFNMTWSDGHPLSYTAWAHIDRRYNLTQPSGAEIEDCVVLWYEYTWRIAQWHDTLCAGEDVFSYVCEIEADKEDHVCKLGMQDYAIENQQVVASWYETAPTMSHFARLEACSDYHGRGWSGIFDPKGVYFPWLQVDLPRLMLIAGIATQGLCTVGVDARVTELYLFHGMSKMAWTPYTGRGSKPVLLIGNTDSNATAINMFDPTFTTLHIRLELRNGTELFGLRFDLLGYAIRNLTEEDFKIERRTDYAIKDDTIDKSQECLDTHFRCGDGSCVHLVYLCDSVSDCMDGTDESLEVCGAADTCPEFSFSCREGGGGQCISLSFFCDRDDHCNTYEDEINCEWPEVNCRTDLGELECENKKCYDSKLRCDGNSDCKDKTDERRCDFCQGFQCFDGSCLPGQYECDGQIDCNGYIGEDEDHCLYKWDNATNLGYCEALMTCRNGACVGNSTNTTCLFNLDERGAHVGCRDATHLEGCTRDNTVCPVNTAQCDSGYCIQQRMVCDGKNDCIHGEDELNCDTYICPGAHRCRGETNCVPKNQLCDGVPQCAQGDDESFCSAKCPEGCECYGLVFFCRDMEFHVMLVDLPWYLRKIDLSNSFFAELAEMRGSNWTDVTFQRFSYMAELVLKNVGLWTLTNEMFLKLKNLLVLDLSYNMLTSVVNEPFSALGRLRVLNLRGNRIKTIESGVFAPLIDLNELQIQENQLSLYTLDLFNGLTTVTVLHTDSYQLICIAENEANLKLRTFTPPKDAIASCDDLIENRELRIVLWVLGWFAFLGNILFIVRRLVKQKGALTKIKILDFTFLNLHIADAIMGVYCIIIASADEHYRGRYIENAEIWKQGGLCQFAGFLFTLAAEIPFIALPLAAVEECMYAFYDLKFRKKYGDKEKPTLPQWITLKITAVVLGASWLALAFLALVPMFGIPYFGNKFYAKSTVCLPVYITGDLPVGFGYSAFLFIICNFCASVLLILCYVFMFAVDTMREVDYDDEGEAMEEMAFSHRLFAVSFTNLSCWLPVVLFGMAGWHGSPVSVDLTPWAALIMIPINAAVNPLIYMIFPDKKRDLGPAADKGKGAKPGQGGAKAGQGAAKPAQGGAKPGQGGAKGDTGGAKPGQGGGKPGQGGGKPGQGGAKVDKGAAKPGQGGGKVDKGGAKPAQGGGKPGQGGAKIDKGAAKPGQGGGKVDKGGAKPAQGGGKVDKGAAKPGQGGGKVDKGGAKVNKGGAKPGQGGGKAGGDGGAAKPKGAEAQAGGKGKGAAGGKAAGGKRAEGTAKPGAKGQAGVKGGAGGVKSVAKKGAGGPQDAAKASGGNAQGQGAEAKADEATVEVQLHRSEDKDDNISGSKDRSADISDDSGVSGSKSEGSQEADGSPPGSKRAGASAEVVPTEGFQDEAKAVPAKHGDVNSGDASIHNDKAGTKDDAKAVKGSHAQEDTESGSVRDMDKVAVDAASKDDKRGAKDDANAGKGCKDDAKSGSVRDMDEIAIDAASKNGEGEALDDAKAGGANDKAIAEIGGNSAGGKEDKAD
ncbi:uncharacterized protein [Branchiostoma lanceolatum]|uniref:uncharacterized protein n=1 Tax=Branchiostoma lanceolatum TaxID=7740 RepID=UPI0034559E20